MDRLRRLFDAFTEKHEILHLLTGASLNGVQIFMVEIGVSLDDCSLVTAPSRSTTRW